MPKSGNSHMPRHLQSFNNCYFVFILKHIRRLDQAAKHWHSEFLCLPPKPNHKRYGQSIQSYPQAHQEVQWPCADSGYVRDCYYPAAHDFSFQQWRKRTEGSLYAHLRLRLPKSLLPAGGFHFRSPRLKRRVGIGSTTFLDVSYFEDLRRNLGR